MISRTDTYCAALYAGTYSVGLDRKFHPIPRDGKPAKGALKISLNPFLILTPDKNILFDCGIGIFAEGTGPEVICGQLESHGLTEFDITDVFLGHLHYDHIGGLAHKTNGYWELCFPEAKVWASRDDWDKQMSKELWYDEQKTEFLHFLDARADLHFMDEVHEPYPEIKVERTGGHSEFHQVLFYNDGEHKYMHGGDVLATRSQVNRKFAAKYDFDPQTSQQERERLAKKAFEEEYMVLAYHEDDHPLFRLTGYDEKTGYITEPVRSHVPA